ncbi:hypothetical protein Apa02nite_073150 [Actinoplanes palleronii]|uniref:Uncharacterized protein n=1 Tax=Actinoplanes palleronii TaxID=113570 RepID=A0ABQ4BKJ9_9ACTN|nr:hypothetical protein Apa02nite_073150 [Actinoplanes palleronii]
MLDEPAGRAAAEEQAQAGAVLTRTVLVGARHGRNPFRGRGRGHLIGVERGAHPFTRINDHDCRIGPGFKTRPTGGPGQQPGTRRMRAVRAVAW